MIVSRINGGLGNQMFQYAAGRALSLKHGTPLGLDLRIFDGPSQFSYALHHFSIESEVLDRAKLPPSRKQKRLMYFLWRAGAFKPTLLRQKADAFDDRFSDAGADTYLEGYWQSERFFAEVADKLRADFKIKTKQSAENIQVSEKIAGLTSVSLHVRRGDYVSDPKANAVHGTCDANYYSMALAHIATKVGEDLNVFIFSDEPNWAKANLALNFPTHVVDLNDSEHQYEDMRLMSQCQHHVIANSSFSWWGAWLNPKNDKVVVAPKTWFKDPQKSNPDICPKDWVRI